MGYRRKIRVMIVDDHTLFREGLRQLLAAEPDIEVIAEAGNGKEALDKALALEPDVLLLDLQMPVLDGIAALREINQRCPRARTIVLTMYREDRLVFQAIRSGAYGYLLKDSDSAEVIKAIRAVSRGEALIDPAVAARVLEEFRSPSDSATGNDVLTAKETELLQLVTKGLSNLEIAKSLSLSEKTVRNKLSIIFQKLHISNRTEAALYAVKAGIAPLANLGTTK